MDPSPSPPTLPAACDFTVFGGTGDLALRKLTPADAVQSGDWDRISALAAEAVGLVR